MKSYSEADLKNLRTKGLLPLSSSGRKLPAIAVKDEPVSEGGQQLKLTKELLNFVRKITEKAEREQEQNRTLFGKIIDKLKLTKEQPINVNVDIPPDEHYPKEIEFTISRDNKGFISKITAKEIQ